MKAEREKVAEAWSGSGFTCSAVDPLIDKTEARAITGLKARASFERAVASGDIAKPVRVFNNRSHFPLSELLAFNAAVIEGSKLADAHPHVIADLSRLTKAEFDAIKEQTARELDCSVRALQREVRKRREARERREAKQAQAITH